jgi:hypothetical protein
MSTRSRFIRKEILRVLEYSGKQGASIRLLEASLADAGESTPGAEIEGHLRYLAEKDYVTVKETNHQVFGPTIVAYITAHGTDLLEGNIDKDPGIL